MFVIVVVGYVVIYVVICREIIWLCNHAVVMCLWVYLNVNVVTFSGDVCGGEIQYMYLCGGHVVKCL